MSDVPYQLRRWINTIADPQTRLAARLAVRQYEKSVRFKRAMSLANLSRLFQRRCADLDCSAPPGHRELLRELCTRSSAVWLNRDGSG
jgi:hypothetical protein